MLDKTIATYAIIGRFSEVSALLEFRRKAEAKNPHLWQTSILRGPEYIKTNAFGEKDVEELVNVATTVLHASRIPVIGTQLLAMADEECEWMSIHILLDEPVATVVELNVELAERLAGRSSPLTAERYFTVMYMVKG
jgi:hypothetical protein